MVISEELLKELKENFNLQQVKHQSDYASVQRICGQVDVVEWLQDRVDELNKQAIDGSDTQITIKHDK